MAKNGMNSRRSRAASCHCGRLSPRMKSLRLLAIALAFLPSLDALQRPAAILPGLQPDGSILLPNQWSLRAVGKQVVLGDFPVNIALHPGGTFAAVLHSGWGEQGV